MQKKNVHVAVFLEISGFCGTVPPALQEMQSSTDCLTLQNADVARSIKKKPAKPRQHRPYKSVSGASLETRIADITKKVQAWESKTEALREKLKQHNQELTLREASAPQSEPA
jgi:hypothetical protein